MKLNHLSVLRAFGKEDKGFYIRSELDEQPSSGWSRHFSLTWLSTPAARQLCNDVRLERNEIILPLIDLEKVGEAIEMVKSIIGVVNERFSDSESIPMMQLDQAMI